MIVFLSPDRTSFARFAVRVSGDLASNARSQARFRIVLSRRTECAMSQWVPVNSSLSAVRLNASILISSSPLTRPYLFVLSVYAPTACSSPEMKDDL